LNSEQKSFSSAGSQSLNQAVSKARRPLVSPVSTKTRPGINLEILKNVLTRKNQNKTHYLNLCCETVLLREESINGERYVKTIRMKKHH
jgi:hypothetical protein